MKRIIIFILSAAAALSLCSCARDSKPVAKHIVLISFDGWASRGMDVAEMPTVKALMDEGSWTMHKRSVWPTSSNKNWPAMFAGTGPDINGFYSEKEGEYGSEKNIHGFKPREELSNASGMIPTIFSIYREKYPKAEIGAMYQWEEIHDFLDASALSLELHVGEEAGAHNTLCKAAVDYILKKKPDLLMVGFNHPDSEGHNWGWYSDQYFDILKEMDAHIGSIVAALKEAGIWDETILLLSSDHGGTGRAHHGSTIMEFETPFVICGKGIRKGYEIKAPMMQYDVAATMAAAAGIEPPQVWVGKPVREVFLDKRLSSVKPVPVSRKAGQVVVIGMDGWASEGMDRAEMPNVKQFIAEGSSTMFKATVIPSLSTENWASTFNGLPIEMHGFFSEIGDSWRAPLVIPAVLDERGITPTVFTLARKHYPEMEMGAIHQWSGISNLIDKDAFNHYAHLSFQGVCDDAVEYIKAKKPGLTLIVWDEPDGAGHEYTWFSKEYFDKLKELDAFVGRVKQALSDAGILDDTIIFLTSDHGGTVDEAHGGTQVSERFSPFVAWGKGIRKSHTIEASMIQYDVAATSAAALGIPAPPEWYGRPMSEIFE